MLILIDIRYESEGSFQGDEDEEDEEEEEEEEEEPEEETAAPGIDSLTHSPHLHPVIYRCPCASPVTDGRLW